MVQSVCALSPKEAFEGLSTSAGGGTPTKRLLEPRSPLVRPLEKQAIQRLFTAKPRKVLARQVSPASEMNPLSSGAFALPRDPDGAHQAPGCHWASELISSCWKFLCSLPSDRSWALGSPRPGREGPGAVLRGWSLGPSLQPTGAAGALWAGATIGCLELRKSRPTALPSPSATRARPKLPLTLQALP